MREILFRAKSKDSGKWLYGYPLIDNANCELKAKGECVCPHNGTDSEIFYWCNETHEYDSEEVISSTIGQYIGFSDDRDVKIFEGDIITYKRKTIDKDIPYVHDGIFIFTGVVEYDDCRFIASSERDTAEGEHGGIDSIELSHVISSVNFYDGQLDVIGNIFDNPELLEGGDTSATEKERL